MYDYIIAHVYVLLCVYKQVGQLSVVGTTVVFEK